MPLRRDHFEIDLHLINAHTKSSYTKPDQN